MNKVILKAQKMTIEDFRKIKKAHNGRPYKKIFFQCELREFIDGDAIFGLVAYGGYKKRGKHCGPPFPLQNNDEGSDKVCDTWPLTFGNLEFDIEPTSKKKGPVHIKIFELLKLKEDDYKKKILDFKPGITKNPHADYTISLDGSIEELNPSPPDPPSDY